MPAYLAQARRDPVVGEALALAQEWCDGHVIDGGPALGHAVKVVNTVTRYAPHAPHHVLAALLLHDAPDFVDRQPMVDRIVGACGPEVLAFIDHLHAEHEVLQDPTEEKTDEHLRLLLDVPWLATAAVADKIVAFQYVTGRANQADSAEDFWKHRPAFVRLLPYFHRIHELTWPHIPTGMSAEYRALLDQCPRPTAAT